MVIARGLASRAENDIGSTDSRENLFIPKSTVIKGVLVGTGDKRMEGQVMDGMS
jgi:hypothetical protein